jgi:hypothetical protein
MNTRKLYLNKCNIYKFLTVSTNGKLNAFMPLERAV